MTDRLTPEREAEIRQHAAWWNSESMLDLLAEFDAVRKELAEERRVRPTPERPECGTHERATRMKLELTETATGQGVKIQFEAADLLNNVPLLHNLAEKLKLSQELPTRGLAFTSTEYGLMSNLVIRRMVEIAQGIQR